MKKVFGSEGRSTAGCLLSAEGKQINSVEALSHPLNVRAGGNFRNTSRHRRRVDAVSLGMHFDGKLDFSVNYQFFSCKLR